MPDALEDVRDIAIELLKLVINTDDEVIAQIVKEVFYRNSHVQPISKQVGWVRHLEEQANRVRWLESQ